MRERKEVTVLGTQIRCDRCKQEIGSGALPDGAEQNAFGAGFCMVFIDNGMDEARRIADLCHLCATKLGEWLSVSMEAVL